MDRGYLAGLAGVLALEAAGVGYQLLTGIPLPVITVASTALVIACMLRVHGFRGTMTFLALVFAIPFGSEFLGVLTGYPYGVYSYSTLVGPRLFGLVPIFIYIAWINIAYLATATTTLGLGRSSYWLAPVDGLVAMGWDIMVDPQAVRAGLWTWQANAGFYGVPLSNFAGWFLVVTILSLVARASWAREPPVKAGTSRALAGILPALLVGSALCFGALALAAGFPYAALIGVGVLLPAAGVAWARIARLPPGVLAPSLWTAARRPSVANRVPERG